VRTHSVPIVRFLTAILVLLGAITAELAPAAASSAAATTARFVIAAEGVSVSAGQGVHRAAGSLVRSVGGHESPDALFSEMRQLTYESGNEHALVRLHSGEFQIHAGGATGIDLSSDISQVIAHTHPYGLDALGPSADDVAMLGQLGQGASILLEHGQTILFGPEGTIAWR
jgi:hypothetical protein